MRLLKVIFCCALAVSGAGCGRAAKGVPQASLPPMLIDDRGVVMPLEAVVTKLAYRPWIPPNQIFKFAVIPPLGNLDTPAHRGVAVEYAVGHQAMLLSEWPKQNFSLLFLHNQDISAAPCVIAHYKADGIAWSTHGKLAMTLQPDGNVAPQKVENEARRLIAAGACK